MLWQLFFSIFQKIWKVRSFFQMFDSKLVVSKFAVCLIHFSDLKVCNFTESPVPSFDPLFMGCWWMPFIICGCLSISLSIPLFFFPKHMKHYYKEKYNRCDFHQFTFLNLITLFFFVNEVYTGTNSYFSLSFFIIVIII